MSTFEIKMPKMGESVTEATITKWFVSKGDTVEEDDPVAEIASDKVDTEIPSPVAGSIKKLLFEEDETVEVGETIALVSLEGEEDEADEEEAQEKQEKAEGKSEKQEEDKQEKTTREATVSGDEVNLKNINHYSQRFYSPLVRSIAEKEALSVEELESIEGHGKNERVRKEDILDYLEHRKERKPEKSEKPATKTEKQEKLKSKGAEVKVGENDEVQDMSRLTKITAEHMINSRATSAHVTNVVEADVTELVMWRKKVKDDFQQREGEKLTFMPFFIEATVKALKDFPRLNASVKGNQIVLRKNINMGIAVALPNDDLIVPVIKNADQKNILGLTKDLNHLADAARNNKLDSDEIQGGTFTLTNFGTFRNIIGTPIIHQPQVAILATGSIEKKPSVLETPTGDVMGIRYKMYLSLSYDHRIVNGAMGGQFLRRVADYLEKFDVNRSV